MKVSALIPPPLTHTQAFPSLTSSFLSFQADLLLISFTFESRLSLNFLSWKVIRPYGVSVGVGVEEVRS